MKVIAIKYIESLKYGTVVEGTEIEVDDKVGESWIKQGLANGKDEAHDKGDTKPKKEVK